MAEIALQKTGMSGTERLSDRLPSQGPCRFSQEPGHISHSLCLGRTGNPLLGATHDALGNGCQPKQRKDDKKSVIGYSIAPGASAIGLNVFIFAGQTQFVQIYTS
jgi:hypothetical protein